MEKKKKKVIPYSEGINMDIQYEVDAASKECFVPAGCVDKQHFVDCSVRFISIILIACQCCEDFSNLFPTHMAIS